MRPPSGRMGRLARAIEHGDQAWRALLVSASVLVLLLVLAIGALLWRNSAGGRQAFGWAFVLPTPDASWNPVQDKFQAWPFIYGTLATSLVAIVLAVPISIGIAVFLAELCPAWLRAPLGFMVELLAAIPSVVYGLWGIFVFLPVVVAPAGRFLFATLGQVPVVSELFRGPVPASGASRLAAGLILAIMIVPTISAVARDVFQAIPRAQREASLALGATRWETIWQVLIPYGLSGILGAVILGLGRALGETMAVTMVIGNAPEISASLFAPGYSLPAVIANEFAEATGDVHIGALASLGLVLFGITLILNALARILIQAVASGPRGARA